MPEGDPPPSCPLCSFKYPVWDRLLSIWRCRRCHATFDAPRTYGGPPGGSGH